MCIIITLPPKQKIVKEITKDTLETAWESNQDGGGYGFISGIDTKKGAKLQIKKGFFKFEDFFKSFYKDRNKYNNSKFVVHFRHATVGDVNKENCQPFFVKDNLIMCHNGTIRKIKDNDKKDSDSKILSDLCNSLPPNFNKMPGYSKLINNFVSPSRVVFLTKYNDIYTYDPRSKGSKLDDIWFSNDYYKFKRKYTNYTNYNNNTNVYDSYDDYNYREYEYNQLSTNKVFCTECGVELFFRNDVRKKLCHNCKSKLVNRKSNMFVPKCRVCEIELIGNEVENMLCDTCLRIENAYKDAHRSKIYDTI